MATINDVAARAGVSVTTVSRVLNNRGYISEKTRKLVYDTMEALNYQPNEIARSLLRKQSNLFGLIVPDVSHPFFAQLTGAIEQYAYEQGYKLLLCNSHLEPLKEREYLEMMKRNRVDGIIMCSHTLEVEEYTQLRSPVVTIDRQISDLPYIASDNALGGRLAAQLLVDKGCRKVAHICGNLQLDLLANLRTEAFVSIMKQHQLPYVISQTSRAFFDLDDYEQIINQLLVEHPDVDGIFATSDIIASLIMKASQRLGKRIPDQLKVIGYDDINMNAWLTQGITTIKQPINDMAHLAVDCLLDQIAGCSVERASVLPVQLIERQTT